MPQGRNLTPPRNRFDCRSCGARIRWVRTAAGKSMPIDPEPDLEHGNVEMQLDAEPGSTVLVAVVLTGTALDDARRVGTVLFMPHHATCPQGRQWRKK